MYVHSTSAIFCSVRLCVNGGLASASASLFPAGAAAGALLVFELFVIGLTRAAVIAARGVAITTENDGGERGQLFVLKRNCVNGLCMHYSGATEIR